MTSLARFGLSDMVRVGAELRAVGARATSMEDGAQQIVSHLYAQLLDEVGVPTCALARLFATHPFASLEPELQECARACLPAGSPVSELSCLTLLGSRGERPEWDSRHHSRGHRAIPLATHSALQSRPMVSRLMSQLGVQLKGPPTAAIEPILDLSERTYNVFYVADAASSPYVPNKEFVRSAGIQSVLGFGGLLASGEVYMVILFAKVSVPRSVSELFRPLSLNVQLALHPTGALPMFTVTS